MTRESPLDDHGRKRSAPPKDAAIAASDADYKVGPGHPPKEHQFPPGQSGNPKGRKRKPLSIAPDLKLALEQALNKKVTLKQGEKARIVTMAKAGIEQLVAQFAKGDRHARRDLMAYADRLGVDLIAGQHKAIEEALAPSHQAILDAFVARRREESAPSGSPPVFASPDLVDDDTQEEG
jgi:hypothetical protein